jgi:hypothetical protein
LSEYKHVGSLHNVSCAYGQEVAARIPSPRLAKKENCTTTNSCMLCTRSEVHLVRTFRVAHFCVNVVSIPFWTTKADICFANPTIRFLGLLFSIETMTIKRQKHPMLSFSRNIRFQMARFLLELRVLGISPGYFAMLLLVSDT